MANSRIAAARTRISAQVAGLGGITPPPVPPDATFPFITLHEVSDKEVEALDGPSHLDAATIQVNCWSKDYEDAWNTREKVKGALLSGFSGTFSTVVIQGCTYLMGAELYDPTRQLHQCIARFHVWAESGF